MRWISLFFVFLSHAQALTMGDTGLEPNTDNGNGGLLLAQKTTLTQPATLQSLNFYIVHVNGTLRLGLYDSKGSHGNPGKKLAETSAIMPVTGWNTAAVSQINLAAGNYWLAYEVSSSQSEYLTRYFVGPIAYAPRAYGVLPSSFPSSPTVSDGAWSFYATLSTGSPTPTPSPAPRSGTPTLVQHVATGMDRLPVTNMAVTLPNPVGAGNALILGIQFKNSVAVSSVVDDKGNTWIAGPTTLGVNSQRMSIYYVTGAIGGTQRIVVNLTGSSTTNECPQEVVSEFYNVSSASALDGSGSSSNSLSESFTTRAPGDLIYHWGVDFSDTNANGGNYNGANISPGSGFTLLSADLQVGSCDQYQVQNNAGAITTSFSASGSSTWGSLSMALKSSSEGTPPASGIRIVHVQHTLLNSVYSGQDRPNPIVLQFPSNGNLLVASFNSGDVTITGVSDSAGNVWSVPSSAVTRGDGNLTPAQIIYSANAVTSNGLSGINVRLTGITSSDCMFILYDIAGASTSPFDKAAVTTGNQTVSGNLSTVSLTPSFSNGVAITVNSLYFETANGVVGSGYVLDSIVNGFDTGSPTSTLDEDNGYAHIYYSNTSTLNFVFTLNGSGIVSHWGSAAAAFEGTP